MVDDTRRIDKDILSDRGGFSGSILKGIGGCGSGILYCSGGCEGEGDLARRAHRTSEDSILGIRCHCYSEAVKCFTLRKNRFE